MNLDTDAKSNTQREPAVAGAALRVTEPGKGKSLAPVFADVLADVAVDLRVSLGSGSISVRELLALREGATLTLDMPLNGLVDVTLNDAVVVRGEIVAVGDYYGIRVTEVAELDL